MNQALPPTDAPHELIRSRSVKETLHLIDRVKALNQPASVIAMVWLVRLSALINLISSLLPNKPKILHWLGPWMPFEISEGRHFRMFLLSMLLFILAAGLRRGKRVAWICTIGVLAIAPILHLGRTEVGLQVMINLIIVGFLLLRRKHFSASSDAQSVRSALIICPLLALALLVFGTARLHELRFETSGPDSWLGCLQAAGELIFVHTAYTQAPETAETLDLFSFLRVTGTLIALLGLFLVLRPVLLRRMAWGENQDRARRLINQYGCDSFDDYALLNDKRYFFSGNDQTVVPYVLSANFAVALADPIGHPAMRSMAIVDFVIYCRQQDWEPVFYLASDELIPNYMKAGLSLFKIGESAHLNADQFHLKGQSFQNLRTLHNRAHRLGIRFQWYDSTHGINESLEHELSVISHQWLEMKKAREMSFDMGSFSIDDIRRNGSAIALDPSGRPIAFATWRPFAQGQGRALDLMRALPEARNIIDFVLIESISHFNSIGIKRVNLGVAPLANKDESSSLLLAEEKAVHFLFENLNHVYGYKSLFEFKRKYRPDWRGRYVAYRRGVHLPLVGLALVRVHAPAGIWKFLVR